jgi:hypothetical protein
LFIAVSATPGTPDEINSRVLDMLVELPTNI